MFKILQYKNSERIFRRRKKKYFAVSSHYYPYICCWSYVFITKIANKKYNVQFRTHKICLHCWWRWIQESCFQAHTRHTRIALVYRVVAYILYLRRFTTMYNLCVDLNFQDATTREKKEEEEDGNFIWLRWLHAITYIHSMYGFGCMKKCAVFIVSIQKCDVYSDTRSYFTGCFHSLRYTHRICKRNENYIHSVTLLLHALKPITFKKLCCNFIIQTAVAFCFFFLFKWRSVHLISYYCC